MSSSLALLCLRVLVMDARVCDACIGVSVSTPFTVTLQMAGVSKAGLRRASTALVTFLSSGQVPLLSCP